MAKSVEQLRQEMGQWGELKLENLVNRGLLAQSVLAEREKQRTLRTNGLNYEEFRGLHREPDCEVVEKFVGREPSGFWSTVWDCEVSASVYVLRCIAHGVYSEQWWKSIG